MVLLINYDLHNYGRDYDAINKLIANNSAYVHPMGSFWIIDTQLTRNEWRDALVKTGDENDEYMITRLHKDEWSSFNLDDKAVAWLRSSSRNW